MGAARRSECRITTLSSLAGPRSSSVFNRVCRNLATPDPDPDPGAATWLRSSTLLEALQFAHALLELGHVVRDVAARQRSVRWQHERPSSTCRTFTSPDAGAAVAERVKTGASLRP